MIKTCFSFCCDVTQYYLRNPSLSLPMVLPLTARSSQLEVFSKKVVLRNFAKFTGNLKGYFDFKISAIEQSFIKISESPLELYKNLFVYEWKVSSKKLRQRFYMDLGQKNKKNKYLYILK